MRERKTIHRHAQAKIDLIKIAEYISRDSPAAADRFIDEAEKTLSMIAEQPEIAAKWESDHPDLADIRVHSDQIDLIRVLHGARDIDSVLGSESDAP